MGEIAAQIIDVTGVIIDRRGGRIDRQRALDRVDRRAVIPAKMPHHHRRGCEGGSVVSRAGDGRPRVLEARGLVLLAVAALDEDHLIAQGEQRMSRRVARVQFQRALQQIGRDPCVGELAGRGIGKSAKIEIIGVEIFRAFLPGALDLRMLQARLDDADDALGDLILKLENVVQGAVEAVGPEMRARFRFDQLRGDAEPIARFAHAALQHVTHAEFTPDLPNIDRSALVGEARIARDHE